MDGNSIGLLQERNRLSRPVHAKERDSQHFNGFPICRILRDSAGECGPGFGELILLVKNYAAQALDPGFLGFHFGESVELRQRSIQFAFGRKLPCFDQRWSRLLCGLNCRSVRTSALGKASRRRKRSSQERNCYPNPHGTSHISLAARSGRRRDHSRRPPTPQDVPFGIRRFMKQM